MLGCCIYLLTLSFFYADVIGKIAHVSDVIPVQAMYQETASNTRTVVLTNLQ